MLFVVVISKAELENQVILKMRAWVERHANGIWFNVALAIPPTAFVVFMLWEMKTKNSLHKLWHSRSHIISCCYAFLCIVSILNLLRSLLQVWQGESAAFNVLSLVTRFGMLLLELSVVASLLQGYRVSGLDALLPALVLSSIIAAIDAAIKAIYIFGFGIPLFIDGNDVGDWHKWSFWLVHKLLLVAVYAFVLCLPHTKWQNKVPAKPTFYNYIRVLFLLNTTSALGCCLLLSGVAFGYWIYGFTNICYHAFYPPLLYATFLREFFQACKFLPTLGRKLSNSVIRGYKKLFFVLFMLKIMFAGSGSALGGCILL